MAPGLCFEQPKDALDTALQQHLSHLHFVLTDTISTLVNEWLFRRVCLDLVSVLCDLDA
jgi:hypothetical protein